MPSRKEFLAMTPEQRQASFDEAGLSPQARQLALKELNLASTDVVQNVQPGSSFPNSPTQDAVQNIPTNVVEPPVAEEPPPLTAMETITQAGENLLPSLQAVGQGMIDGIKALSPIPTGREEGDPLTTGAGKVPLFETGKGLFRLGKGALDIAFDKETDEAEVATIVGKEIFGKFGSIEKFKRAFAEDPAQTALDVSSILSVAGLATKLPIINKVTKLQKALDKAIKITDPVSAVGGALKFTASRAGNQARNLVQSAIQFSDKLGFRRIEELSDAILISGFNVNPTVVSSIQGKLNKVNNAINDVIVKAGDGKVSTLDKILRRGKRQPESLTITNTSSIVKSIDGFLDNKEALRKAGLNNDQSIRAIERVRDQVLKHEGLTVTARELQDLKVGWNKAWKQNLNETFNLAKAHAFDELRKFAKVRLEEIAPQLKKLNPQHGALKDLEEAFEKSLMSFRKRNPIGIKGFAFGALAGGVAGDLIQMGQAAKVAGVAVVLDKIFTNPNLQIKLAKAINAGNIASAKTGGLLQTLAPATRTAFQAGRQPEGGQGATVMEMLSNLQNQRGESTLR